MKYNLQQDVMPTLQYTARRSEKSSTDHTRFILHITIIHCSITLQWNHNEHHGVSNRQPHGCLLKRLFRRRSKKTSKRHLTGLCEGNFPVTSEFLAWRASNVENVSTWWCHHVSVPDVSDIYHCLPHPNDCRPMCSTGNTAYRIGTRNPIILHYMIIEFKFYQHWSTIIKLSVNQAVQSRWEVIKIIYFITPPRTLI